MGIHFPSHIRSKRRTTSFHLNRWRRRGGGGNKVEGKYGGSQYQDSSRYLLRDFNPEDFSKGWLHMEQGLKVTLLQKVLLIVRFIFNPSIKGIFFYKIFEKKFMPYLSLKII